MTVQVTDRLSQLYVGNGVNTRFDFAFRIFDQEDETGVAVRVKVGNEFEFLDETTYAVTFNPDDLGGYVTFVEAPDDQTFFYIAGKTPVDQLVDITNYDNFYPDVIERALDKLTAILQEWKHLVDFETQSRILADIDYDDLAQQREAELKAYIDGIASSILGYPVVGLPSKFVIHNGETQEHINDSQKLFNERIDKQVVYADQYGVIPNNPIEQTSLIEQAIQDTASKKQQLKFRGGTYLIDPRKFNTTFPSDSTYALNIYDYMDIQGEGKPVFKIIDNVSSLAAPKWYTLFHTATYKHDWRINGIVFDGNAENNHKGAARYNQAFIGVFGNSAYCDNVDVNNCIFKNNPGENNIVVGVTQGVFVAILGKNWNLCNNIHVDNGLDSKDFTAVFGYANNVKCDYGVYIQNTSPTVFDGPGARNAFEVHGSEQTFNNNFIKSYFNGAIVNSNWTSTCDQIQINNNIMSDMFLGGVRLWRQPTATLSQTLIKNAQIKGNQIHLNNKLYATESTYKAGVFGSANFVLSIDSVDISDNTVTTDTGMQNISACVYLLTQPVATAEVMTNFKIRRNVGIGTYNGIYVYAPSTGASFSGLVIEENEHLNPVNVGASVNPISFYLRADGTSNINDVVIRRNKSVNSKNGLWYQNNILDITEENNVFIGSTTPRTETTLVNNVRRGDRSHKQANLISTQTIKEWLVLQRRAFKISVDYTKFATSIHQTLMQIPAKARVCDIIMDVVTPIGGTTSPAITVGTANSGTEYLLSAAVDTTKQVGNANSELGSLLTGGKNGKYASWTATTNIIASLSGTGVITSGVVDFYITVEYL